MTEENKFQKTILKENKEEFTEDDPVVPNDEAIDERFRCLDEVTESFYEEQLLGPNTHKSVVAAAEIAKKGSAKHTKSKATESKGKSKGL